MTAPIQVQRVTAPDGVCEIKVLDGPRQPGMIADLKVVPKTFARCPHSPDGSAFCLDNFMDSCNGECMFQYPDGQDALDGAATFPMDDDITGLEGAEG